MPYHVCNTVTIFVGETTGEFGYGNSTDFNYKGELKVAGRIKILGCNADFVMKFLGKETLQILTEVQLPDIGINSGALSIRAGLKQTRPDAKAPNGPTLLVRMDPQTNSAVIVGKISTLGFSRISAIKVENTGFSASIFANLPGNVNTNVTLSAKYDDNIENLVFEVKKVMICIGSLSISLLPEILIKMWCLKNVFDSFLIC